MNKFSIINSLIFLFLGSFMLAGCNTFSANDVRSNPNDPGSKEFVPDQPSDITVSKTNDIVTIRWKDRTDFEDAYLIEQAINDTTAYKELARLGPDSTFYQYQLKDQGLVLYIRVEALTNESNSNLPDSTLNEVTASIPLVDIKNLRVDYPNENTVSVSWEAPLSIETGYKIFQKNGRDSVFTEVGEVTNNEETARTYQYKYSLKDNLEYFYKVVPVKNTIVGKTVSSYGKVFYKPHPPVNLKVNSSSDSSLTLSWNRYKYATYPSQFIIERKKGLDGNYEKIASVNADVFSFKDEKLDTSQTYEYHVRTLTSDYSDIRVDCITKTQNVKTLLQKSGVVDIKLNPVRNDIALIYYDGPTYGSDERHAEIINQETGSEKIDYGSPAKSIAFSPNGEKIMVTYFQSVKIFDIASNDTLFNLEGYLAYFDGSFSTDGKYYAIGGQELTVWNASQFKLIKKYSKLPLLSGIQFDPSNNQDIAYLPLYSNVLTIINFMDGTTKLKITAPKEIAGFSFSPDGKYIATFLSNQCILWDAVSGNMVQQWNFGQIFYLPVASDGIQFLDNSKILIGDYILDIHSGGKYKLGMGSSLSEIFFIKDKDLFYVADIGGLDIWKEIRAWYAIK